MGGKIMIFIPPVSIFSPKDMPYCQHSLLVEKKNSEEYIKTMLFESGNTIRKPFLVYFP
jgi:hypothetical protein